MTKKHLVFILVTILICSLLGCSQTTSDDSNTKSQPTETATEQPTATSEADALNSQFFEDRETHKQTEIELIGKYFDVSKYETSSSGDSFSNYEFKMNSVFDEAVIYGIKLKIGMSYKEVLKTGLKPVDADFQNEKPDGLVKLCDFQTDDGRTIRLGFISDSTVKKGELYSFTMERNMTYSFGSFDETSKFTDFTNTLGAPTYIYTGSYPDYHDAQLEFASKNRSVYLFVRANLDNEAVQSVTIEGYAD